MPGVNGGIINKSEALYQGMLSCAKLCQVAVKPTLSRRSDRFMVPMHAKKRKEATCEPVAVARGRLARFGATEIKRVRGSPIALQSSPTSEAARMAARRPVC